MSRNNADVVRGQLDKSDMSSSRAWKRNVLCRHTDQAMEVVSSLIDCDLVHVPGLVPRGMKLHAVLEYNNDSLAIDTNGSDRSFNADGGDRLLLDDLPQKDLRYVCEHAENSSRLCNAHLVGSELWHATTADQSNDIGLAKHLGKAYAAGKIWWDN